MITHSHSHTHYPIHLYEPWIVCAKGRQLVLTKKKTIAPPKIIRQTIPRETVAAKMCIQNVEECILSVRVKVLFSLSNASLLSHPTSVIFEAECKFLKWNRKIQGLKRKGILVLKDHFVININVLWIMK